jgi:two-component system, LytTR family, sensor kinase
MSESVRPWSRAIIASCLVGLAAFMTVVDIGQAYLREAIGGPRVHLWNIILSSLPSWLFLAALSPVPVWCSRRWPLDQSPRATAIAAHLLGALGFGLAHAFAMTGFNFFRFEQFPFAAGLWKAWSFAVLVDLLVYGLIAGSAHAFRYYSVSRERERQAVALQASLADAQLAGLRAQINPHVLFNTLNAVSVLALKGDQTAVVRVVGLLSEILRSCLDDTRGQEAPLSDELQLVESYLEIQRIRFADRLTVDVQADASARVALVPTLILQPVVENAVTHGISNDPQPGHISIRAHREQGSLHLTVADSGRGFGASPYRGRGLGLSNVRARLHQLYGEAQRLSLGSTAQGGAAVTIVVPYRQS